MRSRRAQRAPGSHFQARARGVKHGCIAALGLWALVGVYPACSDAEFRVSGQSGSAGTAGVGGRDASISDAETDADAGRGGSAGNDADAAGDSSSESDADSGDAQSDAVTDSPVESGPTCDAPLTYFLDADRDTYGADDSAVRACDAPGPDWVRRGGDCRDDLPEVNPAQTDYKPVGFETKAGVSFDYDCSGAEEPDPGSPGAAPASCPALPPCGMAVGYVSVPRTGAGVNALCGSQLLRGCVANGVLACSQQQTATPAAKRCR